MDTKLLLSLLLAGCGAIGVSAGAEHGRVQTVRQGPGATTQYLVGLPHIAFGDNWKTSIFLRNEGTADAPVTLLYFADDGSPLSLPLTGGSATQTTVTVPAHGQIVVETDATGADRGGWAALVYESTGIKAQGIFLWRNSSSVNEAVAPVISQVSDCLIPMPATDNATMPFDNTGDAFSGYGFANTSSEPVTLRLRAYDDAGVSLGQYNKDLPGFGHIQFALTDVIPQTAGKRGLLDFGANVAPLGFKFIQGGVRFTTWQP